MTGESTKIRRRNNFWILHSMKKLSNYLNKDARNFYILQFMRGNITEEVLFNVFPREKALEVIEGVRFGERGSRKTLEMLSRL